MNNRCFSLFGLLVESNFPLSDHLSDNSSDPPDVRLYFRGAFDYALPPPTADAWYTSQYVNSHGTPQSIIYRSRNQVHDTYTFTFADGVVVVLDASTWRVDVYCPPHYQSQDAVVYVTGPVMALVLRLRGRLVLHGSAVAVGDHAVGFIGPAGAGKSTTAGAFVGRGFRALTDDLIVLGGGTGPLTVQPGHSRLCLWPQALEAVADSDRVSSSERISPNDPYWDKRYLKLVQGENLFQSEPLPLAGLYVLGRRDRSLAEARIAPLSKTDALVELRSSLYGPRWPLAIGQRELFDKLAWLVDNVPVHRITAADSLAHARDLVTTVVDHAHRQMETSPSLGATAEPRPPTF